MATKTKKAAVHYHICNGKGCGRWKCPAGKKCNLSHHASCGFRANDYAACLKFRKPLPSRFSYTLNKVKGVTIQYKGKSLVKKGIEDENAAKLLIEILENGQGDAKLWRKARKIDRETATA